MQMMNEVSGVNFSIMDNKKLPSLLEAFKIKGVKLSSIEETAERLSFCVEVQARPGSKRNSITLLDDGVLKVALREKPVEGAANRGVIELFSERLGIAARQIGLVSGEKSKQKRFQFVFLFTAHKGVAYYIEKLEAFLDES